MSKTFKNCPCNARNGRVRKKAELSRAFFVEELLRLWRLTWDFLTIVLVATDAIILPIRLAWPDRFVAGGPVDELYKVRYGEKM